MRERESGTRQHRNAVVTVVTVDSQAGGDNGNNGNDGTPYVQTRDDDNGNNGKKRSTGGSCLRTLTCLDT
jgi:hypothetical protein